MLAYLLVDNWLIFGDSFAINADELDITTVFIQKHNIWHVISNNDMHRLIMLWNLCVWTRDYVLEARTVLIETFSCEEVERVWLRGRQLFGRKRKKWRENMRNKNREKKINKKEKSKNEKGKTQRVQRGILLSVSLTDFWFHLIRMVIIIPDNYKQISSKFQSNFKQISSNRLSTCLFLFSYLDHTIIINLFTVESKGIKAQLFRRFTFVFLHRANTMQLSCDILRKVPFYQFATLEWRC